MSTLGLTDERNRAVEDDPPDSGEHPVTTVAAELTRLAECSSDPAARAAFRRASRALYQQPGGRRPTNDRRLLQDAQHLLAMGLAKSENDALAKVAGTIATDYQSLKTIIERLRRKRRKSSLKII